MAITPCGGHGRADQRRIGCRHSGSAARCRPLAARRKDTELALRRELHHRGWRYRIDMQLPEIPRRRMDGHRFDPGPPRRPRPRVLLAQLPEPRHRRELQRRVPSGQANRQPHPRPRRTPARSRIRGARRLGARGRRRGRRPGRGPTVEPRRAHGLAAAVRWAFQDAHLRAAPQLGADTPRVRSTRLDAVERECHPAVGRVSGPR